MSDDRCGLPAKAKERERLFCLYVIAGLLIVALAAALMITSLRPLMAGRQLRDAASRDDVRTVRSLLSEGVAVDSRGIGPWEPEWTPLMCATVGGSPRAAAMLLEHGANVNAQDWQGKTALIMAVQMNDRRMVDILIEHGADVNIRARWGTALERTQGKPEIEARLRRAGAR